MRRFNSLAHNGSLLPCFLLSYLLFLPLLPLWLTRKTMSSSLYHPCSLLVKLPDLSLRPYPTRFTAVQSTTKKQPLPSLLLRTIPLAASMSILLHTYPADAGIMSGFSGMESVPGPKLPEIEFLKKLNDLHVVLLGAEANQKKYADNDARFKSSPVLKELLEKSKQNKERNRRQIQDKYCIRGAEWGVGDCSADAMSEAERENFITMLKKKSEENMHNP